MLFIHFQDSLKQAIIDLIPDFVALTVYYLVFK
jgi:hypothetical protein